MSKDHVFVYTLRPDDRSVRSEDLPNLTKLCDNRGCKTRCTANNTQDAIDVALSYRDRGHEVTICIRANHERTGEKLGKEVWLAVPHGISVICTSMDLGTVYYEKTS